MREEAIRDSDLELARDLNQVVAPVILTRNGDTRSVEDPLQFYPSPELFHNPPRGRFIDHLLEAIERQIDNVEARDELLRKTAMSNTKPRHEKDS
ncbi:hypothetical protein EK904_008680 [Melospiza melodia maxima]|nr:hypothetical protein EK904_008680 [Melospiza melodia maxima]